MVGILLIVRGKVSTNTISLAPPLVIEMPIPSQESERSCICVLGVWFLRLSAINLLDFTNVQTVWWVCFLVHIIIRHAFCIPKCCTCLLITPLAFSSLFFKANSLKKMNDCNECTNFSFQINLLYHFGFAPIHETNQNFIIINNKLQKRKKNKSIQHVIGYIRSIVSNIFMFKQLS